MRHHAIKQHTGRHRQAPTVVSRRADFGLSAPAQPVHTRPLRKASTSTAARRATIERRNLPASAATSETLMQHQHSANPLLDCGSNAADVIIIGAGPAGLAAAGALKHLHPQLRCILLEASDTVGSTWHKHYDRLHLHSSKAVSYLPYLQFAEDVPRYPSKKQVADYLAGYARHFHMDVRLSHRVTSVQTLAGPTPAAGSDSAGQGRGMQGQAQVFEVTALKGQEQVVFQAPNVVVATGQNSVPWEPKLPGRSEFKGTVIHSADYKNPEPFKGKKVLVVGFGNSAGEIALDLSEKGAKPTVLIRTDKVVIIPRGAFAPGFLTLASMDYKRTLRPMQPLLEIVYGPLSTMGIPNMRPYGVPQVVPWWGGNPGLWDAAPPLIDIGQCAGIVRGDIKVLRGSLEGFSATGALIAPAGDTKTKLSGDAATTPLTEEAFDAVILCTGYRECFSQLLSPELRSAVMDPRGAGPLVSGDTTPVPGLYFIGWDNLLSLLAMIRQEATHVAGLIAASIAAKR